MGNTLSELAVQPMQDVDWPAPSDLDRLAARLHGGDQTVMPVVVEAISPRIRRLARDILTDEHLAEDVVQETLLVLQTRIAAYDPGRPFASWVLGVAARKAIDQDRMRRRFWKHVTRAMRHAVARDVPPADDPARATELRKLVDELLEELPPQQRRAFALRDLQSLSIAETAQILDVTQGAAKAHVAFARRRLREILSRRHPEYLQDPTP